MPSRALTDEQAAEIRRRYAAAVDLQGMISRLARDYGVSHATIRLLIDERTYRFPAGHPRSHYEGDPRLRSKRPYAALGERVRQYREQARLTQSECARRVGMPQSQLSMLEAGLVRCGADRLQRLAEVTSGDADELRRLAGFPA